MSEPKITLQEWAQRQFAKPPNRDTLRRWVRHFKIHPLPEKVGREYLVSPDAKYRHVA